MAAAGGGWGTVLETSGSVGNSAGLAGGTIGFNGSYKYSKHHPNGIRVIRKRANNTKKIRTLRGFASSF